MTAKSKEKADGILSKIFELIVNSGTTGKAAEFVEKLDEITANLPDQFMTLNNFERFIASTPNSASVLSDLSRDSKLLLDFLKTISASQYLADILVRHPAYFRFLFSPTGIESPLNPSALQQELFGQTSIYKDIKRKEDFVRRIYKREILRIGARDICGKDNLESTTLQISQLADSILKTSFEVTTEEYAAKYGEMPPPISCIALGKLGGSELNYSSDIDLLFIFSDEGSQDPHHTSEQSNYFVGHLVKFLTAESPEGHLYRVDLRLRPDGHAGPPAQSLSSVLSYYESRGELWERQMLIKARHVAGDERVSEIFLNTLRPFIYPRTWLENPIDEIPRMKIRIETSNPTEFDIKLRRGGIRDIEFITQALQLLNGGSNPDLQTGNTLQAIRHLGENQILNKHEASQLSDAYRFFRLVEHRLQLFSNKQTHTLPSTGKEFRELSKRCNYKNERKFRNELFGYFESVAELFDNVFRIEQPIERSEVEQLLEGSISDERTRHVIENYGLERIEESYRNVQFLSRGVTRAGDIEFPSAVTRAFREIAPHLLEDIKLTVDPDLTLRNMARLVPAIKSLEVFYGSLSNEVFSRLVLTLCSKATRFVDYITVEPLLLDLAIAPDRLLDIGVYMPDSLPKAVAKEFNEIKLGMLYLLGDISLSEMHARWTEVAEKFFLDAVHHVFPKGAPTIIAGGKFGSGEMSFMSDLDVIFILPDKFKGDKSIVEKKIPEVQKNLLDATGKPVFTVDLKLRPEGKSAPLLMTESEYNQYLEKRLSVWERMAMTRFRVLGQPNPLQNKLTSTLVKHPLSREEVEEISGLYSKAIQSHSYFDEIDIKTGDGGLFAVEFLVQTLALKQVQLLTGDFPTDVIDLFRKIKSIDAIDKSWADETEESFVFYRIIEFSNYASLSKTNYKIPHDERELASLAAHLDFKNSDEFLDSLRSRMRRTSSLLRKILSGLAGKAD